jgi:hypothetical protein
MSHVSDRHPRAAGTPGRLGERQGMTDSPERQEPPRRVLWQPGGLVGIDRIEEWPERNALGEAIFFLDVRWPDPVRLIVLANPRTGQLTKVLRHHRGNGYLLVDPLLVPLMLSDIIGTISQDNSL